MGARRGPVPRGEAGGAVRFGLPGGVSGAEVLEQVGGYDETLRRARLGTQLAHSRRRAPDLVHPDVAVTYWPRAKPATLRRQMFATGVWRGT